MSPEGPASGRWSSELSRTVREALELVATPEVAGRLIFDALTEARLSALPTEHEDLRAWSQSDLVPLVAERLGEDAAAVVLDRIELVLRALGRIAEHRAKVARAETAPPVKRPVVVPSPKRRDDETVQITHEKKAPERPPERITVPPIAPMASGSGQRVVLVTADSRLGSELRVRVGTIVTVLSYRSLEELSRSPVGQVHTLVLDIRGLAREFELPVQPGTLVLWPADVKTRDRVANRFPRLSDVRFAGEEVGLDDLATVIRLAAE